MKKFIITILIILFSCNYTFAKEIRYSNPSNTIYVENGKYYDTSGEHTMYLPDRRHIEIRSSHIYLPNGEKLNVGHHTIYLPNKKCITKLGHTIYLPNGEYYEKIGCGIYYSNRKPEDLYYRDLAFTLFLLKKEPKNIDEEDGNN